MRVNINENKRVKMNFPESKNAAGGIDFGSARARIAKRKEQDAARLEAQMFPQAEPEEVKETFSQKLRNYTDKVGMNLFEGYKEGGQNIIDSVTAAGRGEQSPWSAALQTVGQVAETAFLPVTAAIQPGIEAAAEGLSNNETFAKFANSGAGDAIVGGVEKTANAYEGLKARHPEATKNTVAAANIAMLFLGEKPAQEALNMASKGATSTAEGLAGMADDVVVGAGKLKDKIPSLGKTPKTTEGVVAEITQPKTPGEIPRLKKGLDLVDTTDVTTYKGLADKITEKIGEMARKVDEVYDADGTIRTLKDLVIKETTPGGKTVTTNFVNRGIDDLITLYKSTGEDLAAAAMKEVKSKAIKNGLSSKEINDLARTYGQEFGKKAFSKTGDPLTSITAARVEATRTGMKETARQGVGDVVTSLDKDISHLYDLRTNIDSMVNKVNQLSNKVTERGLFEKLGYGAGKVIDIASGGFARNMLGQLFPSNVGLKTMNSLNLEANLAKNLKMLDKALSAGSDDTVVKVIHEIMPKKAWKAPQFETRSSFERSPIIKKLKTMAPSKNIKPNQAKIAQLESHWSDLQNQKTKLLKNGKKESHPSVKAIAKEQKKITKQITELEK